MSCAGDDSLWQERELAARREAMIVKPGAWATAVGMDAVLAALETKIGDLKHWKALRRNRRHPFDHHFFLTSCSPDGEEKGKEDRWCPSPLRSPGLAIAPSFTFLLYGPPSSSSLSSSKPRFFFTQKPHTNTFESYSAQ